MKGYDHRKIEKKWQKQWAKDNLYRIKDRARGKENFFLLVEFPYPSGNLHVGHWYAFAVPDILARFLRMTGKNVLYPMGFDAFGLPAENAAIKNKLNPRTWTENNIKHMTKQIESMGTSFDWSRKVSTIDPAYYKWTQWLFLQLFKSGLAYQKETAVNWCPKDKTVLANEQVIKGLCERCDTPVEQRQMLQWNMKITDYADRLVDDLDPLDWPEEIKDSQRNWIGRSEGAEIDFPLVVDGEKKYKYVILHGFKSGPDRPRWAWIKRKLEDMGHEVLLPALPNPSAPVGEEWVQTALNATSYDDRTILVGHSLGAVTALKVLEKLDKPIHRLVTIGGFTSKNFKDNPRPFERTFTWEFDGDAIRKNVESITVLHDPRDHAVSDEQAHELSELLRTPLTIGVSNKSHFTGDIEPDVLLWLRPTIRVFTTRPDTLFGATYMVLAPEHPWVTEALNRKTIIKNNEEVQSYVNTARKRTERERQESRDKTGVQLEGVMAENPASGEKIPLYVADYVLGHYGTGAIMAVPAHDERDYEFAQKLALPIRQVVAQVVRATTGADALRADEPVHDREAVMCIIKHWAKDEYLCIEWKQFATTRTFISGGIESGESDIDAGIREIREESGYLHPKFIRRVAQTHYIEFYHQAKKKNIRARMRYLYFELEDGEQIPLSDEEQRKHDLTWKSATQIPEFVTIHEIGDLWKQFFSNRSFYEGEGVLIHSGPFDGLASDAAKHMMTERYGRPKKTYRLRDWIVSRQRYWGVPIPIVHCEKCGPVAVPEKQLPVKLPNVEDYLPTGDGKSPLAKVLSFVNAKCPECGGAGKRETDTFDTFVDSSWYFLRYCDPHNAKKFASKRSLLHWMPVDLYSGGAEHTTMHVLYSRFWQKALFDLGLVADQEPYTRRKNRSLIMGPDGQKMSKSRGNVIDPDAVVARLGADTVRMYLAFIGPYSEVGSYPWNPDGVVGVRRFIERVWRLQALVQHDDLEVLEPALHRVIKKVGEDITALKFNTAIAQLMMFLNAAEKEKAIGRSQWQRLLILLAPFAPHVAEELWHGEGKRASIHKEQWPTYRDAMLVDDTITIIVQVDGKTRGDISTRLDSAKEEIERLAKQAVAHRLTGREIARAVVVPGRLVNFVLKK